VRGGESSVAIVCFARISAKANQNNAQHQLCAGKKSDAKWYWPIMLMFGRKGNNETLNSLVQSCTQTHTAQTVHCFYSNSFVN